MNNKKQYNNGKLWFRDYGFWADLVWGIGFVMHFCSICRYKIVARTDLVVGRFSDKMYVGNCGHCKLDVALLCYTLLCAWDARAHTIICIYTHTYTYTCVSQYTLYIYKHMCMSIYICDHLCMYTSPGGVTFPNGWESNNSLKGPRRGRPRRGLGQGGSGRRESPC